MRSVHTALSHVLLHVLLMFLMCYGKHEVDYDGYTLYRVFADSREKLDFLESLYDQSDQVQVDFWNFPGSSDEYAEVLVSPPAQGQFRKALDERGITYSVMNENIQRAIDQERIVDQNTPKGRKRVFKDGSTFDVSVYNSWEDISSYLRKLPDQYPSLATLHVIGRSHEGRDLIVVKVGKNASFDKPAMWMDFTIHAREWITTATGLYILDTILYNYQSSQRIQRYLDNVDWYFLPVMNPDGYTHAFTKDRMWRKNRRPNNCTIGKRCCTGVDLNRNFGYGWGGRGSSSSRCSNQYGGEHSWSELESTAVRDFVLGRSSSIKVFLTFHCYAQSWRHPYSFRKNFLPDDVEELRELARNAVDSLYAVHNVRYKVTVGGKRLSGVSRDWAKGEAKIKYVYAVEMASRGNGFVAPVRSIVPSGEENWAALTVLAEKLIEKYVTDLNGTTNSTQGITDVPPNTLPSTTDEPNTLPSTTEEPPEFETFSQPSATVIIQPPSQTSLVTTTSTDTADPFAGIPTLNSVEAQGMRPQTYFGLSG